MSEFMGGALLAETLFALGVRDVFTLHGGHLDPFLIACPGVGIRLTDVRHEATAGHAAEAYAMTRPGELGVCVVTAGPGFTNCLTAIASAFSNAVPTLFIAGAPPESELALNELQGGFSQVQLAAPITKWSQRVSRLDRLPDLVEKASRIALSGRPGPVFLEVPINVMFGHTSRILLPVEPNRPMVSKPTISAGDADRVLDVLARAQRPVIIAGSGVVLSDASAELQRFVDATGLPVVSSSKAHGVMPFENSDYLGPASILTQLKSVDCETADVVFLVGARAGLLLGGRSGSIISSSAEVLQIDIDASEIGRLSPVTVGLVADCSLALGILADQAEGRDWSSWDSWKSGLRAARSALIDSECQDSGPSGRIHPNVAALRVFEALPPSTIVVVDGGEVTAWCEPHNRASAPGEYLTTGYLGTLGVGQGFAIGASVAHPGRPVVLIMGDGAVGFHLQEFDTMSRHDLSITTIVLNNSCWAMSMNAQDLVFGKQRRTVVMLEDRRYDQVAIALGCEGMRIVDASCIVEHVGNAIKAGRATCIDISTDPEVMHPITFGMAGADPKRGKISMPYYQNE